MHKRTNLQFKHRYCTLLNIALFLVHAIQLYKNLVRLTCSHSIINFIMGMFTISSVVTCNSSPQIKDNELGQKKDQGYYISN